MFSKIFPKIHAEGYKFLVIAGIITIVFYNFSDFFGLIGFVLTIWVYYFFRDPDWVLIYYDNYLVSPADGLITDISERSGPEELRLENTSFTRVSVFMNVFNCHVNRVPSSGRVKEIYYKPGKFLNASLDKASEENERNYFKIKLKSGQEMVIVQIAGLIARRIVCEVEQGQTTPMACSARRLVRRSREHHASEGWTSSWPRRTRTFWCPSAAPSSPGTMETSSILLGGPTPAARRRRPALIY